MTPTLAVARLWLLAALMTLTLCATVTPTAAAQTAPYGISPPYAASAPTKGALVSDGPNDRYRLGGTWLYRPDGTNVGIADDFEADSPSIVGWSTTTIPNSYNAGDYSQASMNGYVGWYRRDFTVPQHAFKSYVPADARAWTIQFESVNYNATVWLNGHELGAHSGAYLPFEFLLKGVRKGVNRLVVRVDDQRSAADLPPGPGGGWWNYGGLLDVVYLHPVQRAEIGAALIRPILPCPTCGATIDEQATIHNPTSQTQTVSLTGVYGREHLSFGAATIRPGGSWSPEASVSLRHPRLWAPGSPNLYRATLTLSDRKGRTLAGYTYESGVREIRVTTDGRIELNGRLLNLRGVNLHEQTTTGGAALTMAQMESLIGWVRELGAGIIRAHYPLNPEMEEMADRDGILLWSEIPVYQVGNAYLDDPTWLARALSLLRNNIETNQDHPSILLWSVGNELPTPVTTQEASYISAAAAEVHELDPTRPAAMAVSNWPGVPCQAAYAPLDVIGVNEYFGWFDAGGGSNDDRDELSPYLDYVRSCYPHQALMITEFGFGGDRQGPVEVRGTYPYQDDEIAFHLGVFATKPWLSGAIYFPLQDFAVSPGYTGSDPLGQAPFVQKGVVDQFGNLKPSFSVMESIYRGTSQIAPARR